MTKLKQTLVLVAIGTILVSPSSALAAEEDNAPRKPSFKQKIGKVFKGVASWYGGKFHGRRTASGAVYNKNELTCAHRTLPFGSNVQVTNPDNGSKCNVTVTDRGPYHGKRIIDLSKAAARRLGITGVARVVCRVVSRRSSVASKDQTAETEAPKTTQDSSEPPVSTAQDVQQ